MLYRIAVLKPPFLQDCDDEGTLFSWSSVDVTYVFQAGLVYLLLNSLSSTDDQMRDYLTTYFLPNANSTALDTLLEYYPQDPAQGSPFDTGDANALTPQSKRMAAIQGDLTFFAPRRLILQHKAETQSAWSFRAIFTIT